MRIAPFKYPKKIPDTLFYHKSSGPEGQYQLFNMLSLKDCKKCGFLVLQKTYSNIENYYKGNNLIVNFILSLPANCGNGEKMLEFAKNYSRNHGCNGHIILKSDISFTPQRIPHLFYRKNRFSTLDKDLDKKMDKFIKRGQDATSKDFRSVIMYYPPPEKYPEKYKPSIFSNIKNFIKNLFPF